MIELPDNFASGITSGSSAFIAELSPTLVIVISVLVAGLVVGLLINAFKK